MHIDGTKEVEGKDQRCFEGTADNNIQRKSRALRMKLDAVFVRRNPTLGFVL